jgi:hypothetical protein
MGRLGEIQSFDASSAGGILRAVRICVFGLILLKSSLSMAELRP